MPLPRTQPNPRFDLNGRSDAALHRDRYPFAPKEESGIEPDER